ncbi:hypothetical protein F4677DRAFT_450657 [Hypoxylon crocopeplum]|nr:hypothetical protein F4677DRAFT_450657 [Hypoxylon crocopeplum]
MPPESDLPPLPAKKRWDREDLQGDEESISETTAWLRGLLEQTNRNGQRSSDSLAAHAARRSQVSAVKVGMTRLLKTDEVYSACRLKLEALSRDGFYLRYGDYFAFSLGALCAEAERANDKAENEARIIQTTSKNSKQQLATTSRKSVIEGEQLHDDPETDAMSYFLSQPWGAIDQKLQQEDTMLGLKPDFIRPMSGLIEKLAGMANMYDLAKDGHFLSLVTKMRDDLRALVANTSVSEDNRHVTHVAILNTVKLFFQDFTYDEEAYDVTSFKPWPIKNRVIDRSTREEV